MGAAIDLHGQVFGHLTALSLTRHRGLRAWICQCSCGQTVIHEARMLRFGHVKSCGCRRGDTRAAQLLRHGGARRKDRAPEYTSWKQMNGRCYNKANKRYPEWGGRGITVCDEWRHDFARFLADMGPKPSGRHSIERIDNNGSYHPGNCIWATPNIQSANRRNVMMVEFAGKRVCLSEAARLAGLGFTTVKRRIKRGWPQDKWFIPLLERWDRHP